MVELRRLLHAAPARRRARHRPRPARRHSARPTGASSRWAPSTAGAPSSSRGARTPWPSSWGATREARRFLRRGRLRRLPVAARLPPRARARGRHRSAASARCPATTSPSTPSACGTCANLFCRNRRVAIEIDADGRLGRVTVVMVVAMIVGPHHDRRASTRATCRSGDHVFDPPLRVARGDEIGVFHLGSTAVVLVEKRRPRARGSSARGPCGTARRCSGGGVASSEDRGACATSNGERDERERRAATRTDGRRAGRCRAGGHRRRRAPALAAGRARLVAGGASARAHDAAHPGRRGGSTRRARRRRLRYGRGRAAVPAPVASRRPAPCTPMRIITIESDLPRRRRSSSPVDLARRERPDERAEAPARTASTLATEDGDDVEVVSHIQIDGAVTESEAPPPPTRRSSPRCPPCRPRPRLRERHAPSRAEPFDDLIPIEHDAPRTGRRPPTSPEKRSRRRPRPIEDLAAGPRRRAHPRADRRRTSARCSPHRAGRRGGALRRRRAHARDSRP